MESQKGSILGESIKANQAEKTEKRHAKKQSIQQSNTDEPPKEYEKMLQKLEADIRGHIRVRHYGLIIQLEHEMKIHLDYLEGRVEELENLNLALTTDNKRHDKKI